MRGTPDAFRCSERRPLEMAEQIHVDPVCGMKMPEGKEKARRTMEGRTFHLCSDACVEKFDRDPARYARPEEGGGHLHQ
jgi:YHS domain-containing protein